MKVSDFLPSERVTFGVLIIVGYILVVWYGASGHATAPNANTTIHDAMLALGPLVGVVVYSVFKIDREPNGNHQNGE